LTKAFGFLLRIYSYLFHLALSVFLLGAASISAATRQPLNLRMLPFAEDKMLSSVFTLGAIGLLATLLALTRIFRYLFPVWAAVVLYLMFRGFFFSPYTFPNPEMFKQALWLTLGALVAFLGALLVLKGRRRRRFWL
jgi:hypothetical protein